MSYLDPFDMSDLEFFYNSTYLRKLHGQTYRGHDEGDIRSCVTCGELAIHCLLCLAGTARNRGLSREQFIDSQQDRGLGNGSNPFPQSFLTNYVKRGVESYLPSIGRVAKPERAARGAKFTRALLAAYESGALSVSVEVALHVLEHGIRVSQADGRPRTESGRLLPFGYIASRVERAVVGQFGGASACDLLGDWGDKAAERVWYEIVEACRGTNAEGELDKHVFRYSAQLSTAFQLPGSSDNDDSDVEFVDDGSTFLGQTSSKGPAINLGGEDGASDDSRGALDGPSDSSGCRDAVYEWAKSAADAVYGHVAPLDDLPSVVEQLLGDTPSRIHDDSFDDDHSSKADLEARRARLRDLKAQVVQQATRILIWDEAVEKAVGNVFVGGRLEFDRLDVVVDLLYEMLCEKGYPFEKEERGWSESEVRRVTLRGWAQRIADKAIRPS